MLLDNLTDSPDALATLDAIAEQKNAIAILDLRDPRLANDESTEPIPVASVPEGRKLEDLTPFLDKYLDAPLRRTGTATHVSARSFVAHVERFKAAELSAIFATHSPTAPAFLAIYDYHKAGGADQVAAGAIRPGFAQHRAKLTPRLSDEWVAWHAIAGKDLDQLTFASFLQDRMADLTVVDVKEPDIVATQELLGARIGGPQSMMSLARGIEVRQSIAVKDVRTLETGEAVISYVETQTGVDGTPLTTPTLFFISIPVFYAGPLYRVPVRVRYRVQGGKFLWALLPFRADKVFDHAFNEMSATIATETGLPVFLGAPES